jgi:5-methylcytosine-specific restriction enzyme A
VNDDYESTGFHLIEWLKSLFLRLEGPSFGALRSPDWPRARKAFITAHPECAVCYREGTLLKPNNVHHIRPFHLHPELELDPTNFITLCRDHHFLFGHFMNWASYNVEVIGDSRIWHDKITSRP